MIIYTDRFIPKRFDAVTVLFVVLVRPSHKNNKALHAHELKHIEQFQRNWFSPVLYLFSKSHRQDYEVEAYRAQLKINPGGLDKFADMLAKNYRLDISVERARFLLE